MSLKTAIAFFIFNRPDTTLKVFEAIKLAKPEQLLVVADGPRFDRVEDFLLCEQTRAIVEEIDWPCDVLRNYAKNNLGCKIRVTSGLDWVFEQVTEAIILEDDCLPHPDFFIFSSTLLDKYREDERIAMIGGTNYLLGNLDSDESYCFSRYFAIWGWATWRRAWRINDSAMTHWPKLKDQQQIRACFFQDFMQDMMVDLFDQAYLGKVDTWDVQWFYSCLFNSKLSIVPRKNLISNIGLQGTHTSIDHSNHNFPTYAIDEYWKDPEMVFPTNRYDDVFFQKKFMKLSKSASDQNINSSIATKTKKWPFFFC